MSASIFAKIDGVVDYKSETNGTKSGHFLLFNIDGRPKICFTSEDEDISEEVTHIMSFLLTNCLSNFSVNPQTK